MSSKSPLPSRFSPQQQAVIDFVATGRGSAFVEAVAGAGKTTTLIAALAKTTGSVAFCAYNKAIADEIKAKINDMRNPDSENYNPELARRGNQIRIGTFHSFGFSAWRRIHPQVKVDADLKADRTIGALSIPKPIQGFVIKLISLAKQRGMTVAQSTDRSRWYNMVDHFDLAYEIEDEALVEKGIEMAIDGLKYQIEIAHQIIDFDDMIYMPIVSGCRMWENDFVFVDEAQDTNPARRQLTRKMLRRQGRAIFVGDRHQAIYGFTGADNDAIDQIVRDFNATILPLTITYRCPKRVVQLAQTVVSHIEAHETAPDGDTDVIDFAEFMARSTVAQQEAAADGWFGLHPTQDAILCRKTKPLVEVAYSLIRKGVPCHVEGREIGAGLLKLIDRFKVTQIEILRDRLTTYAEREAEKLKAKGRETQAEALMDRIETIFVIMDSQPPASTVQELRGRIHDMFLDGSSEPKPTVTLATVHKSKGREWQRVFVLGRNAYMPSKWARQQWQVDQENNLVYVAYTRAKQTLVLINVDDD